MHAEKIAIRMPDLFISFLKERPAVNPNYDHVHGQSEEAVIRECQLVGRPKAGIQKGDFSYFGAVMAPTADTEKLRVMCDWLNWIFPFDDQFDDGEQRDDYEAAREQIGQLMRREKGGPLVDFHTQVWERIEATTPEFVGKRYGEAMRDYCSGTLAQIRAVQGQGQSSPEEALRQREQSVCVRTLFALVEYAEEMTVEDQVWNDAMMDRARSAANAIVLLHNDLLSYKKEESEEVPHNVVAAYRIAGLSAQGAVDKTMALLGENMRELETISKSYFMRQNPGAARYLEGIKNVIKANLWWSFRSGRFFNQADKDAIRCGGFIEVLAYPSFCGGASVEVC